MPALLALCNPAVERCGTLLSLVLQIGKRKKDPIAVGRST
jgi:hypothetical protein